MLRSAALSLFIMAGSSAMAGTYTYYIEHFWERPSGMSRAQAQSILAACTAGSRKSINPRPSRIAAKTRRGAWARYRRTKRCAQAKGLKLIKFRTGRYNN